jgi:hypothetical protein
VAPEISDGDFEIIEKHIEFGFKDLEFARFRVDLNALCFQAIRARGVPVLFKIQDDTNSICPVSGKIENKLKPANILKR